MIEAMTIIKNENTVVSVVTSFKINGLETIIEATGTT
jgi:hypothetical protein